MTDRKTSSLALASLFLLSTSILFPATASATSEKQTLRFNVSPNGYPPYLIVENRAPSGIMWDVMSLIADRLGYELIPEKIPRKRVDQMLLDGYIDATPRAREWTDEPGKFLFTDPVVAIEEVFFIPKDSELAYRTPEDLFSRTVVTHLGYIYPTLEPHFESGRIRRFDVARDRDMFFYVLHGNRFDAAVADRLVGQWFLRNEGLREHFRTSAESISTFGFRIMLRKDWQDFADEFNRELARIRENGELDAILANYR
ncbi:substrate-binding periplasmic protein [Marinobacter pelagius]|uniref:Amino acid ABC transporter substrate-binding protein, PAAT family (TC 3.A.1.3.-) n=1 Tax=Marinobacter pelagius TaxID=379482 RepID=A0A1I4W386_9GAMM|nr:transporter substrate-binding domain-containing protein [Marinobacter pelagius]SFN07935.1 amino acid ABC transporter substrate-binding protein, PAAT family (TC 3.A.1.3.-) [Marinobacter pelagius]